MADRIGQQLGNYQLIRLLGEGGFAEVYLGEHLHLGTQAAIKVLQTQLTNDDREQFRTEARIIARLIHPNIVRVLEFGVEGKTPFLVMDYAPNGTLRRLHPKGTPVPLPAVVSYIKQVADALQFAHDEKLIHRDVKPENMLLGRRGEVLLSDFGIALVAQSSRYQRTQDMAGTIAYMAPEQIQGKPRKESDQYALAIVVYEWLSGDRPFHGSFTEIAVQHAVTVPPPLSERIPISAEVERVVMRALAKGPGERFESVEAFAGAFSQAAQGEQSPSVSPRPSPVTLLPTIYPTIPARGTPPPSPLPLTLPDSHPRGTVLFTSRVHAKGEMSVSWSPDGQRIVSGGNASVAYVWNIPSKNQMTLSHGYSKGVKVVAWSPQDRYIAVVGHSQTMQLWDANSGTLLALFKSHPVASVSWSPDGQRFVVASPQSSPVFVWNVGTTGRTPDGLLFSSALTYQGHASGVNVVVWSPDGQHIASASREKLQIWEANTGTSTSTYQSQQYAPITALAWSPDGRYIASASIHNMYVTVWNTSTGEILCTYQGHRAGVNAISWARDGLHIASASSDRSVHIWEALTERPTLSFQDHSTAVCSVSWSPEGHRVASASVDGTVKVWQAK